MFRLKSQAAMGKRSVMILFYLQLGWSPLHEVVLVSEPAKLLTEAQDIVSRCTQGMQADRPQASDTAMGQLCPRLLVLDTDITGSLECLVVGVGPIVQIRPRSGVISTVISTSNSTTF